MFRFGKHFKKKGLRALAKEILIDDRAIRVYRYCDEIVDDLFQICVEFKVTSKEYHDITTLLYKGKFQINVPEKDIHFHGKIQQYSTSVTNLYEKGNVADFKLCLREIKT